MRINATIRTVSERGRGTLIVRMGYGSVLVVAVAVAVMVVVVMMVVGMIGGGVEVAR